MLTHPPDLPVQPLGQYDSEREGPFLNNLAFFGHGTQNRHALTHAPDHLLRQRLVHGDHIFLFVIVTCPEDFVYDITVVGQKDEPLGVFVQPTYGEDPLAVLDVRNDIIPYVPFRGRSYSHGFIQRDKHHILDWPRLQPMSIHLHPVTGHDLIPYDRLSVIDKNNALLNKTVGFTS